jgi:hypothetical protein
VKTVLVLLLVLTVLPSIGQTNFFKTFDGGWDDRGNSVQQTNDGGYIIAGVSSNFDSLLVAIYLIKTNKNGDTLWTKKFEPENVESANDIKQTADGGYIITGVTYILGNQDVLLVKTNSVGDIVWTKVFGGTGQDEGLSIQQTNDDGYIICGWTTSYGAGWSNVYLIKTNLNGDTLWTRTYGGVNSEYGFSVQQTNDGGYIIGGITDSFGAGGEDVYLIKINATGEMMWQKTYGGADKDEGWFCRQTNDGGYIIAGTTKSFAVGILQDAYLIKTDADGDTLWTKSYGYGDDEWAGCVQQTADGGYIIVGLTASFGGIFSDNIYLIKTDENGTIEWEEAFGNDYTRDVGNYVQQTNDGGYIVTGYGMRTESGSNDIYLIKTDSNGYASGVRFRIEYDNELNLYPNPSDGSFTYEFTCKLSSKLETKIFDTVGHILYYNNENINAGLHKKSIELNYSQGIYFLSLQLNNEKIMKKFVIVK